MNSNIKHTLSVVTMALAATLILFGTSYAKDSNWWLNPERYGVMHNSTPARDGQVTISGTIDTNRQLISNKGEAFKLTNNESGMEVQSLVGKKVQVKGTVMDAGGQKSIDIHQYTILDRPRFLRDSPRDSH